jgi:hypothetical protein
MPLHKGDKSAGFTGLIAGLILLLATMYALVQYTNAKFEGHSKATATAHQ